jgi:hypothetical protein
MLINEDEVRQFLEVFPSPTVYTATSIREGYGVCIKPVPTICGAEIICNPQTMSAILSVRDSIYEKS